MLTLTQRNIKATYVQANENDTLVGMQWYDTANHICKQLARAYQLPLETVVGVMAVLSPRCKWEKNIELTELAITKHRLGECSSSLPCLNANAAKAFEILDGADPMLVMGGYKVNAFYQNILDPNTSYDVTVDTHAISIWNGERCLDKQTAPIFRSIKKYTAVAEDYQAVAKEIGIAPHQLQAITWVTYKRINNI
jgi:hypothetical protein